MVLCLGVITLVCSALLAGIYVLTEEPIEKASQKKTEQTIAAVSPEFSTLESCNTEDGVSYYVTRDSEGKAVAYVVNASSVGFGGSLNLMVGFLPDGTINRTAVLSHSETPGLGAKCIGEDFSSQFVGFNPAERSLQVKKDGGDVDAITASTITSRAYCAALRNAVDLFGSICEAKPSDVVEAADSLIETVDENMEENSNE